ncbi:MAG: anti-sigma regulatory factor [Planctomycetes bacterium]|nr:anti-sigma regulatory factor [Planctomycetota bacterium]
MTTSVSELANNLFFHASHGGRIILSVVHRDGVPGVQLESRDEGPGIADVDRAMKDGYSTNGGLGGGLPGVKRLMHEFLIESAQGRGTHVSARMWKQWP